MNGNKITIYLKVGDIITTKVSDTFLYKIFTDMNDKTVNAISFNSLNNARAYSIPMENISYVETW